MCASIRRPSSPTMVSLRPTVADCATHKCNPPSPLAEELTLHTSDARPSYFDPPTSAHYNQQRNTNKCLISMLKVVGENDNVSNSPLINQWPSWHIRPASNHRAPLLIRNPWMRRYKLCNSKIHRRLPPDPHLHRHSPAETGGATIIGVDA